MSEFRYLTFDCYGTLIDWRRGIETALGSALGSLPLKGSDLLDAYQEAEKKQEQGYKSYREVLSASASDLASKFGIRAEPRSLAQFAESVPRWPAFPDTTEALSELGKKGYKRYILSNVDTDLLKATVAQSGLSVDGFVTAEESRSYKPDLGHWRRFMEKTGAREQEILHVAQSIYHDIMPTQKLGITSAWVNRYGGPLPPDAHPAYVVGSLKDLVDILD